MGNRVYSDSPKLNSGKLLILGLGCFVLASILITVGQSAYVMKSPHWVIAIFDVSALVAGTCGIVCIPLSSSFPSSKRRKRVTFDRGTIQNNSNGSEANP